MKRLFDEYAYSDRPRAGCWWDATYDIPQAAHLEQDARTDVAIIGAGFTGLSAALHLAAAGVDVTVLDAHRVGWGASGRNGGFCCLGGGMAGDAALDQRFGRAGRIDFRRTELAAIRRVENLINAHSIEVDRHSQGETALAHRAKDVTDLVAQAKRIDENYGVSHELHSKQDLAARGMAGPFHGGLSIHAGFGLNPRKFIGGLAKAAQKAGACLFERSPVSDLQRINGQWTLTVNGKRLRAAQVIIATNGYSSEDLPEWLAGRYMPSQSNVLVTRPLTEQELEKGNWTSEQMSYDTRNLLHYFRLMPDRRFLFGMRGGLLTGDAAEKRAARKTRSDFDRMFPAWRGVAATHGWSGMVCIARDLLPFVGAVPAQPGLWAGLCYHGNGVAMASYSGALLAQLVQGRSPDMIYPAAMQQSLRRFELGRWRRFVMPLAYAGYTMRDL